MAMPGVPRRTIAEILGRRALQMVRRYPRLSPEHLGEAAGKSSRRPFESPEIKGERAR